MPNKTDWISIYNNTPDWKNLPPGDCTTSAGCQNKIISSTSDWYHSMTYPTIDSCTKGNKWSDTSSNGDLIFSPTPTCILPPTPPPPTPMPFSCIPNCSKQKGCPGIPQCAILTNETDCNNTKSQGQGWTTMKNSPCGSDLSENKCLSNNNGCGKDPQGKPWQNACRWVPQPTLPPSPIPHTYDCMGGSKICYLNVKGEGEFKSRAECVCSCST